MLRFPLLLLLPLSVWAQDGRFSFDPNEPYDEVSDEAPRPDFVSNARRLLTAPELPDAPDSWIDDSFRWVDFILGHYPPALKEHPVRRAALIRLDDILHIESAPAKPLVQQYYRDRLEMAVEEIERTEVREGMRIWKLYNHGFLVRTPTVSFTFDLVPGIRKEAGFRIPAELLDRLVAQSDATFMSHRHGDHANQEVARLFLAAGKPVVAPEGLWADEAEFRDALTYPERSTSIVHEIGLQSGETLRVVAYPGHQGETVLNNVHLVTSPEGFTVVQTGDQWNSPQGPGTDYDWLAHVGRDHDVDVLLPNCWTKSLARIVRGVDPALVLTGHENEMDHTVSHREDYTQTYNRLFGIRYPAIVMTWGESFHYEK